MKSLRKPWRLQIWVDKKPLPLRSLKTKEAAEKRADGLRKEFPYTKYWAVLIWEESRG
jgi:hypothetical protein